MAKAVKRQPWKMPTWMEPYREHFQNTGGNSVEELMNDHESNMHNNCIRATLCIAIKSQVGLLMHLHREGALSQLPTHDRAGDAYVLPASASHGPR